jgi:hypothetical protein
MSRKTEARRPIRVAPEHQWASTYWIALSMPGGMRFSLS